MTGTQLAQDFFGFQPRVNERDELIERRIEDLELIKRLSMERIPTKLRDFCAQSGLCKTAPSSLDSPTVAHSFHLLPLEGCFLDALITRQRIAIHTSNI